MSSQKPKNLVLDHYHCTLFLPLIGLEKSGLKPIIKKHNYKSFSKEEGPSYYYFSPTIRNILYDRRRKGGQLDPIKEWRIPSSISKDWELCLDNSEAPEWSTVKHNQHAKITSVRLFQYFNDLYLLSVHLEPTALLEIKEINKPIETLKDEIKDNNKKIQNRNNEIADPSKHQPLEDLPQTIFEKINANSLQEFNQKDPENMHLYQQLIMENWMHFTRLIRLIYPSFSQQSDENKIAPIYFIRNNKPTVPAFEKRISKNKISEFEKIGDNFSPILFEILSTFFHEDDKSKLSETINNDVEFYDDRMFVSTAYGIAGNQLPATDLKRINSLVSYVDRQADSWSKELAGFAYTPNVILDKVEQQSFALWQGLGGYYTFTDFSNTYLNRGADFRNFIATEHIPHIYDRMLIQALLYQASLRHYDNEICYNTKDLVDETEKINIEEIKNQRAEFIKFTNQYWFHKLTEQMQGKEIFDLQQKGLGLKEHYDIIKDELERTDEYLQTEHDIKENKFNSDIAHYGLGFALLALYYTILPMLNNAFTSKTSTLWQKIGCWFCDNPAGISQFGGLFIAIVIIPLLIFILYKFIKSL